MTHVLIFAFAISWFDYKVGTGLCPVRIVDVTKGVVY